ncbi:RNA polymerase sigma factor [Geodermatophilus sp. URMC 60]|jgi:RNA polymerase sigma factor (sigma-70 family)
MSTMTLDAATTGCSTTTLLERAGQGDQLAWQQLVHDYDGLVRSVARSFRLQAADVHDVAQTTWLRLVQHLHTIRDPERLAGWLAVTATRESLSVLRRAAAHDLTEAADEIPDSAADLETAALDRDTARDVWAAVSELPSRQRNLLLTLFREEVGSYDEVSTRCAMPIGSIGPTRARALSHLRRKLEERGLGLTDL